MREIRRLEVIEIVKVIELDDMRYVWLTFTTLETAEDVISQDIELDFLLEVI